MVPNTWSNPMRHWQTHTFPAITSVVGIVLFFFFFYLAYVYQVEWRTSNKDGTTKIRRNFTTNFFSISCFEMRVSVKCRSTKNVLR